MRDSIAAHLRAALVALRDPATTLDRLTAEHAGLLAAVEARDVEGAGALMREHILGLYQEALR